MQIYASVPMRGKIQDNVVEVQCLRIFFLIKTHILWWITDQFLWIICEKRHIWVARPRIYGSTPPPHRFHVLVRLWGNY